MHELRRLAYLEALGIEYYESRRPLPGAAASRPRPIIRRPPVTKPVHAPVVPDIVALSQRPAGSVPFIPTASASAARKERVADAATPQANAHSVPRFSLVTILAGDWLWLEELGDMPLTTEQVQLVQSMACALQRTRGDAAASPAGVKPDILLFDWPLHNNRQLDSGDDAARAGVAAFVSRRLEQSRGRGIVVLGQSCANRVLPHALDIVTVCTASSADILRTPSLKRQVWQDLLPLLPAP